MRMRDDIQSSTPLCQKLNLKRALHVPAST